MAKKSNPVIGKKARKYKTATYRIHKYANGGAAPYYAAVKLKRGWYESLEKRTEAAAVKDAKRIIDTYTKNPDKCAARYGELSTKTRKRLKSSTFGLPEKRAYPMPDVSHARNAKSRASTEYERGNLTESEYRKIQRKANRIIRECGGDPERVKNRPKRWKKTKKRTGPRTPPTTKSRSRASASSTRKSNATRAPSLNGRKLQRSPVALANLQNATELGHVLEVGTGDKLIRWDERKKPALLYNPKSKTLFWFYGPRIKETPRQKTNQVGPAARTYGKWTANRRGAEFEREAEIPDSVFRNVERLGNATMLAYRSDKFASRGNPSDYEHKFGKNVSLYKFGGSRPPWVFVVRGGRMTVTPRGIVG